MDDRCLESDRMLRLSIVAVGINSMLLVVFVGDWVGLVPAGGAFPAIAPGLLLSARLVAVLIFFKERLAEPELNAAVEAWESRLAPLLDDVAETPPPPGLYAAIEARLPDGAAAAPAAPILAITPDEDPRRASAGLGGGGEVDRLQRRVALWRSIAVAASLAFAALVGVLVYRPALLGPLQPGDQRYIAVFQDGDVAPRFVMSVDLNTRQVTIRPIGAAPAPDRSYQLWVVSETLGEGPQSLGLLEGAERPTRKLLDNLTPAALKTALFGISIEPLGGSPTGKPTGTAIHGTLIPTDTRRPE